MQPWEIHPSLVHFPIALLLSGVAADLYARARHSVTAAGLLIAGVLVGLVTGLAGFLAFFTVPSSHTETAHDRILWHLALALASVLLFAGVTWVRWRGRRDLPSPGALVGEVAAALLLGVAGYLGGHIVYHGGMGIEPNILSPELRHHAHEAGEQHTGTGTAEYTR
jgi:uncharacterized membrane protein